MTSRMRTAIGDAMTLLKTANVTAATAVLQRALGAGPAEERERPAAGEPNTVGFTAPRRRRLGDVLQVLRSGLAEANEARPRQAPTTPAADERFVSCTYRGAAGSIAYKLYVPTNRAGREMALVLMLHGCTQNPDDFALGTRMNRLADEFGVIVAWPHQPRSANPQGCWNWFDPRHQQRGAGEPAVLAGLAQELATEFGVDGRRIFAAGLSAGGAMADVLASTYPEVFSAVGIHSGLPHGAASDVMSALGAMKSGAKPSWPAKAAGRTSGGSRRIVFHGGADATVHVANGEQILDRVRAQNPGSAAVTSDSHINGRKVTRTLLDGADDGALAEHWLVHGGAHAWSGGDGGGSFTDASGPDASREMLRFFLSR